MADKPRALIIKSSGTNCDEESCFITQKAGFEAEIIHANEIFKKTELLRKYHLLYIPGGFTYGDDLGAGTVFGNEILIKLGWLLKDFVKEGKLILGVCNGFQILVRSGLLPDPFDDAYGSVTLSQNSSGKFECRWVCLKISSIKSEFLKEGNIIELPVAHGEGKFLTKDRKTLDLLYSRGQVILQYTDKDGNLAGYPYNPNGSIDNIAGICDSTGRILGLMPHPERFNDITNHPLWTRQNRARVIEPHGLMFFRNAFDYVRGKL